MARALPFVSAAQALLICLPLARADVEPPARPVVFLALESPLQGKLEAVKTALKATLPRMPGRWALSVVNGCRDSQGRLLASPDRKASEQSEILEAVAAAASCSARHSSLIYAATSGWSASGGSPLPRHHIVLLSASAPSLDQLEFPLGSALRRGFTVSFISFQRLPAGGRQLLARAGAGRVHEVAPGPRLAAALRAELAWSQLARPQQQAIKTALAEHERRRDERLKKALRGGGKIGLLGELRGSSKGNVLGGLIGPSVGGVVGTGGLGLKGLGSYSSKNPKLRRADSLVGSKLALTFRAVSCQGACDLADARRRLLAAAGPLLQCLEQALGLTGREEVTATFGAGKVSGSRVPVNSCLQRWLRSAPAGLSATLLVGAASAVE